MVLGHDMGAWASASHWGMRMGMGMGVGMGVSTYVVASHWGLGMGMGMGMGVECHEVGWIASLHIAMHCFGGYLVPRWSQVGTKIGSNIDVNFERLILEKYLQNQSNFNDV